MMFSWVESAFVWMLNQSISASWLILAVILVRMCMKHTPKVLRYVLWAFVVVRLLCPVSIESTLSLVPDIEILQEESSTDNYFDSVVVEDAENLDASVQQELPEQQEYVTDIKVPNKDASDKIVEMLPEEVVDVTDRTTDNVSFSMDINFSVAAWIWTIGNLLILCSSAICTLRLRNKVCASIQIEENVWICDEIQSPFIFGVISPRIYMPSFVTKEDIPYILAHENEHLKYCDHLWKPFGFFVLSLHWFNPLVWIAYALFCRDIELACDERVIRHLEEEEKIQYSKRLLLCNNPRQMIFACPVAFGEIGVKERVKSILKYKKPSVWIVGIGVVACILIAVCFMTNPNSSEGEDMTDTESTEHSKEITELDDTTYIIPKDTTLTQFLETQMGEPVSETEIEWFGTKFFNTEENRMPNMFLTSFYDIPENIDLNKLFYGGADGIGGGEITDTEKELLHRNYYAEEEGLLDVSRTTTDEMNAILQKYINLSLEQTNKMYLEYLHYLPEYDAYYKVAGDTEYTQYLIMAGWRNEDGSISLVYHPISMSTVVYYQVTLKQEGENYYFLSNLQLPMNMEVYEGEKISAEKALETTSDVDGQIYTTMLDGQKGYVLRCSSPASGLMTKVLCKTSDGGNTFEEYLDISDMRNYPCGVYFFTEEIGYIVTDYHCCDSFLYRTEDGGKTWRAQMVYIPGSWYRYVNGLSIKNGVLQIEVVLDDMSMYYEYTTDDMGETWKLIHGKREDTITYNGRVYKKSDLSDAALQWLELPEQERLLSSYFPPELIVFEETWGITLGVEDIKSTGLTLNCTQSGGEPTGDLHTGGWYVLEMWTKEYGWEQVPCYAEVMWTQEAWMIPMNDSCKWEVNWEWLYGELPEGKYRIGKEITDFRGTGDYDSAIYYAEFEITE